MWDLIYKSKNCQWFFDIEDAKLHPAFWRYSCWGMYGVRREIGVRMWRRWVQSFFRHQSASAKHAETIAMACKGSAELINERLEEFEF
ncbi:MAG: hypothetical protein V3T65_01125 [Acidobacteriota bacterium]